MTPTALARNPDDHHDSTSHTDATDCRPRGREPRPRLFFLAVYDDPEAFAELVPKESTPRPVAIAEDGSAAEIDLYPYDADAWTTGPTPTRRIVVR